MKFLIKKLSQYFENMCFCHKFVPFIYHEYKTLNLMDKLNKIFL